MRRCHRPSTKPVCVYHRLKLHKSEASVATLLSHGASPCCTGSLCEGVSAAGGATKTSSLLNSGSASFSCRIALAEFTTGASAAASSTNASASLTCSLSLSSAAHFAFLLANLACVDAND